MDYFVLNQLRLRDKPLITKLTGKLFLLVEISEMLVEYTFIVCIEVTLRASKN